VLFRSEALPLAYWLQQAHGPDASVSNDARTVLIKVVVPQLTETMLHDTNDSRFRLALIERLNTLPGVQLSSTTAEGRRARAAALLGQIGLEAAVPALLKVAKGNDPVPRPYAIVALGQIRSQPQTVVPLLITLLEDPQDGVPGAALKALGSFGDLAKTAVPKLLDMLKTPDRETRNLVRGALKRIDPEAAAKVTEASSGGGGS